MTPKEAARKFVEENPEAAHALLVAGAQWAERRGADPTADLYAGAKALSEDQRRSAAEDALALAADVAVQVLLALI